MSPILEWTGAEIVHTSGGDLFASQAGTLNVVTGEVEFLSSWPRIKAAQDAGPAHPVKTTSPASYSNCSRTERPITLTAWTVGSASPMTITMTTTGAADAAGMTVTTISRYVPQSNL